MPKEARGFLLLELELQVVVGCLAWVLEIRLRSSEGAVYTLNHYDSTSEGFFKIWVKLER